MSAVCVCVCVCVWPNVDASKKDHGCFFAVVVYVCVVGTCCLTLLGRCRV